MRLHLRQGVRGSSELNSCIVRVHHLHCNLLVVRSNYYHNLLENLLNYCNRLAFFGRIKYEYEDAPREKSGLSMRNSMEIDPKDIT